MCVSKVPNVHAISLPSWDFQVFCLVLCGEFCYCLVHFFLSLLHLVFLFYIFGNFTSQLHIFSSGFIPISIWLQFWRFFPSSLNGNHYLIFTKIIKNSYPTSFIRVYTNIYVPTESIHISLTFFFLLIHIFFFTFHLFFPTHSHIPNDFNICSA